MLLCFVCLAQCVDLVRSWLDPGIFGRGRVCSGAFDPAALWDPASTNSPPHSSQNPPKQHIPTRTSLASERSTLGPALVAPDAAWGIPARCAQHARTLAFTIDLICQAAT